MAGNTDYFPKKDTDLRTWCSNYRSRIAQDGPALGLTPTEIADQQQWCDEIIAKIDEVYQAKLAHKAATARKESTKKNNMRKLRKAAHGIKSKTNYGLSVGKGLGIIGGNKYEPEAATYKPKFKAMVIGNHVRLTYTKKGISGVEVYRMIPGHENWKNLGRDNNSPYIDLQPLKTPGVPELRRYKMIGILDDKHFGQFSDEVEVTVMYVNIVR